MWGRLPEPFHARAQSRHEKVFCAFATWCGFVQLRGKVQAVPGKKWLAHERGDQADQCGCTGGDEPRLIFSHQVEHRLTGRGA